MCMDEKCPFCKNMLELGNLMPIKAGKVYWIPNNENIGIFPNPLREYNLVQHGAVIFSSGIEIIEMKAYICKKCQKIIIDYNGSNKVNYSVTEKR